MLLKKILSTLLKLYSKLVTELPIIYIYTLKTLFDKHLNTNRNEKIYACFVDFKKAFDSVWHGGLFFKLLENKIDGPLYQLTKSLYTNSKCVVKLSNSKTAFLSIFKRCMAGVHIERTSF
jgi:hypothetical protein